MRITHAGYDTDYGQWGLWAITNDGEHWFIPTDEASCREMTIRANATGVEDIANTVHRPGDDPDL